MEENCFKSETNTQVYLHGVGKWSKSTEAEQSTKMTTNVSIHLINSSQPPSSVLCGTLWILTWEQRYLTTTLFVTIIITVALNILTCPFTIVLNVLVIVAVRRKHYLQEMRHVLLACLAATDLLVGAVCQPLMVMSYLQHILGVGPICLIDTIVYEIASLPFAVSLFHLVIISCERYVAIKHALRYTTLVTTRRVTAAVIVAWVFPLLVSAGLRVLQKVTGKANERSSLDGITISVIIFGSLLAILFFQGVVLLESRRIRKHIKAHLVSEATAKELLKKDKAAITTTIIVAALFVCYAPQIAFYGIAYTVQNIPGSVLFTVMKLIDALLNFNSIINPVLYCARTQEFRRAFRELLHLQSSQVNVDIQLN